MPDGYTLQARRLPVAAVAVPPIVLAGAGIVTTTGLGVASGVVLGVIAAIAGQLGRDRGRNMQPELWRSWGGSPTLRKLQYRGGSSTGVVERLHARIGEILGEILPTAAEESAEPSAADERYEEVSARIRAVTRDGKRFPLLLAENINYGQRRNMLGLRREGVVFAGLTIIVAGLLMTLADGSLAERAARYGPGAAAGVLALLFWIAVVTPSWVKLTADAYADQFVGAIDILHAEPPGGQGASD
jgi:hypothetical protein